LAFPAKNLPMKHSSRSFFWFYDISPEHPFYAAYKGKFPLQIVVFPKSFVPKTYIFLMVPGEKHLKGSYVDFSLYSNLRESDIKEMTLAYGVEKEYLSKKDQNSSRLWKYLPSKKWEAQPTSYLSEDSSYIYFNASVDGPGTFSIVMGDG
jgi:hypothetical protein